MVRIFWPHNIEDILSCKKASEGLLVGTTSCVSDRQNKKELNVCVFGSIQRSLLEHFETVSSSSSSLPSVLVLGSFSSDKDDDDRKVAFDGTKPIWIQALMITTKDGLCLPIIQGDPLFHLLCSFFFT